MVLATEDFASINIRGMFTPPRPLRLGPNAKNWKYWNKWLMSTLAACAVEHTLSGEFEFKGLKVPVKPEETPPDDPVYNKMSADNDLAMRIIVESIDASQLIYVKETRSAKTAYEQLCSFCQPKGFPDLMKILSKFYGYKAKPGESIVTTIATIKNLRNELAKLSKGKETPSETSTIFVILQAVDQTKYRTTVDSLQNSKRLTMEQCQQRLLEHECRIIEARSEALAAKKDKYCSFCDMRNHSLAECYLEKKEYSASNGPEGNQSRQSLTATAGRGRGARRGRGRGRGEAKGNSVTKSREEPSTPAGRVPMVGGSIFTMSRAAD